MFYVSFNTQHKYQQSFFISPQWLLMKKQQNPPCSGELIPKPWNVSTGG